MHLQRLAIAAAAAFLLLSPAGAAEPPHTVVVTATRMEQSLFDVPAAIDAISGDALREHKLRVNLSETVSRVPGLHVQNRFNYAQDLQVSSRGFGARASFGVRGVRLIQDGIPLTMPDGQGQTGLFDLDAAEKVEVLRGPFAALYGNSSGGVIQLITRSAEEKPTLELSTTAAEDDLWRYGAQVSARAGPVDLSGNLSRFETDGFRDHSATRRDLANLKARYAPSEASSLVFIANVLDQPDTQDPLGLTQVQLDENPDQVAAIALTLDTRKSIRHAQGGLAFEHAFSDRNRVRVVGYYGDRDLTQFLANPATGFTGSGGVVDLARRFGGAGVQWDHSGTLGSTPFEIVAGVEYDRMKERRRGFVNAGGTLGDLRRDEDDTVYSLSEYLIAEWEPDGRWKLAGGVRRTDVRFRVVDYFIVGPNPDDSGRLGYDSTHPVIGVQFTVTPDLNLFAAAGRAFETPTFAELAYRPDGTPGLNFALDAASSDNLELGAKLRFVDAARLTATLFRSDTEQDIVTGPAPFPGRNTFVNAARTRREGAELGIEALTEAGLDLYASYTYTRARFDEFVNFSGVDLSGRSIPGVPEQSVYAEASWRHAPSGFTAGIETRWIDRAYADDENSAFADDYLLVNLHAGLAHSLGGWQLREFVRVDNVADEDYVGSVIVNGPNARYFEPGPGRTFYVGVVANFSP